jgi:hypothetical protein
MRQVERLVERLDSYTIDEILNPYVAYLADGYFDQQKSNQHYQDTVFPNYRNTLANWIKNIHAEQFDALESTTDILEIDHFHQLLSKHLGVTISNIPADDDISKCYYSQLISILINNKDRVNQIKLSKILL